MYWTCKLISIFSQLRVYEVLVCEDFWYGWRGDNATLSNLPRYWAASIYVLLIDAEASGEMAISSNRRMMTSSQCKSWLRTHLFMLFRPRSEHSAVYAHWSFRRVSLALRSPSSNRLPRNMVLVGEERRGEAEMAGQVFRKLE
jgi:hypothetical protein